MSQPLYTISIAVHNNLAGTKRCLESLSRWCPGADMEIILTDNASTDGTASYMITLEHQGGAIRVVRRPTNEGFPIAHNRALTMARGTYFLILNNDVVLTGPGLLEKMSRPLDSDQFLALCGADSAPSELDPSGSGRMGPITEYIEASCLMAKTELLRLCGMFDPAYDFAYAEDSDLSLRLRLLGYRLLRLRLPIRHDGGRTAPELTDADRQRVRDARRRNHETLRARWGSYLACKDRFLEPETRPKPVAIVTLNRFPNLLEGLLLGLKDLPEHQEGIVVADPVRAMRVLGPRWRVVAGAEPFCFARNANIGIAASGNADILLVNDDVTRFRPEDVRNLQRIAYRYPDVGILCPQVDGHVGNRLQHRAQGEAELVVSKERLCFVCVYLRRQVLRHLGPLDEDFVEYGGEDCEYSLRAQGAGYKLGISRRVTVNHLGQGSFRRVISEAERVAQMGRMRKLVIQKQGAHGIHE